MNPFRSNDPLRSDVMGVYYNPSNGPQTYWEVYKVLGVIVFMPGSICSLVVSLFSEIDQYRTS